MLFLFASLGDMVHANTSHARAYLPSGSIGTPAGMHPAIAQHRASIAAICLRYGIRRLEVFGSAARGDDFVPESSDADFLVEFAAGAQPDLHSFYGAKAELEQLLGRGVDLVEPGAVRNPYVLASINRHREPVYGCSGSESN